MTRASAHASPLDTYNAHYSLSDSQRRSVISVVEEVDLRTSFMNEADHSKSLSLNAIHILHDPPYHLHIALVER